MADSPKREDTYVPPSFLDALKPGYLGDPETVDGLLQGYGAAVLDLFKKRASGTLDVPGYVAAVAALGRTYSDAFRGKGDYAPIVGFSEVTLPIRMRGVLGEFYTKHRATFNDDALQVLFAAYLPAQMAATLKDQDDDLADLRMAEVMRLVREVLLGIEKRR